MESAQKAITAGAKPAKVGMKIHTGMLESLGINMYTSIGKSLVEFLANSFDADATKVEVSIPFAEIEQARTALRAAKKASPQGIQEDFKNVYETLPENIEIVVKDDGHGMTITEVEDKYLAVNRNRRKDSDKSESGLRAVMGRKGLGKLAGFGTAEEVVVWTKRKGENYSTTIVMNFEQIKQAEDIGKVEFAPKYDENLSLDEHGTKITLRHLRCDSLKSKEESVKSTIARNFFFTGSDFEIFLNVEKIEPPSVDYEFIWPPEAKRTHQGLAEISVKVYEGFEYPILCAVKFRARGTNENGKERGSLPAYLRGARIYCNQRLAAGPTLLNLGTGMHNFHAQDYMECIVHADVLDQQEVDLISTNRSDLKTDNEVVESFVATVTDLMKTAIYEHSKFRDAKAEDDVNNDPTTKKIVESVQQLAPKNRKPAMKILTTLASQEGVESEIYQEVAPFLVNAINSSDVLIQLIKTGINPDDLKTIIGQLRELAEVEKSDVLKLYKGRRNAINGLRILQDRSYDGSTQKYEDELHSLLKLNPWLIRPEYTNYLTSDRPLSDVAKKLTAKLQIDDNAPVNSASTDKRPDLVFVAADANFPTNVCVVELKSPNVPLTNTHLSQLEGYMMEIEAMVQTDYGREANVTGHLIGNLARPDTQSTDSRLLANKIANAGPSTKWEVRTLPQLLERAKTIHLSTIQTLEAEEGGEISEEIEPAITATEAKKAS